MRLLLAFLLSAMVSHAVETMRAHGVGAGRPSTILVRVTATGYLGGQVFGPSTTDIAVNLDGDGYGGILSMDDDSPPNGYTDFAFVASPSAVALGWSGGGAHTTTYPNNTQIVTISFSWECPDRSNVTLNLAATLQPQAGSTLRPDASVQIQLYVNGMLYSTEETVVLSAGPGNVSLSASRTLPSVSGDFTYDWKINGVSVGSGSRGCADEVVGPIYTNATINAGSGPTDNSGTTDTKQSGGNTTTTTTNGTTNTGGGGGGTIPNTPGGTTSGPGVPNTPGGNSTTTNVTTVVNNSTTTMNNITNQDIYNDFRQALIDAGKSGSGGGGGAGGGPLRTFVVGDQAEGVGGTQGQEVRNAAAALQADAAALSLDTVFAGSPTFPGSVGKVWIYNGTLPMLGAFVIDFSQYADAINAIRLLCLACLLLAFWFAGARMVGWAFAN